MNKHAMANEYKILCSEANSMVKKKDGSITSNGWVKVDGKYDRPSNFKGVLYEKDGQYAICFVGTDRFSAKDWGANAKMALTGDSKQIRQAQSFAKEMKDTYGLNSGNTESIGHSEGGTEATVVGIQYGLQTTTFNAYGVGKKYIEPGKNYNNITNYRDPHDPVSKLRENVGTTYITPNLQNEFMAKSPFGFIPAHKIDNMGDCMQSVPVDEYKKSHPFFINKISDANISRQDIANMDPDLFKVYEKEIDNRMANNSIYDFRQENSPNPFGWFGRDVIDEKGGLIGNDKYSQYNKYFTNQNSTGNSSRRQSSEKSSHKSSSGKSSGSSSEGKWVTINGNHVLIKD